MKPETHFIFLPGLTLVVFLALLTPADAASDESPRPRIADRCMEDVVGRELAHGRRQWFVKCGYLTQAGADGLTAAGYYPSMANFTAPVSEESPCRYDGIHLGACPDRGCYTESETVIFNGKAITVPEAAKEGIATVSSFSNFLLSYDPNDHHEVAISRYLTGEERGTVYRIFVASGHQVEVTHTHPLVTADGDVIKAEQVVAQETVLLTVAGPQKVERVDARDFVGPVWNVEPESEDQAENILVAEGFLTGSVRYQNQWADDLVRLQVRDVIKD